MNRQEAKAILALYRAGGQDASDPQFAAALAVAEQDAELREWFGQQLAFDAAMSAILKSISVPAHLLETLQTEPFVVPQTADSVWTRVLHTVTRVLNAPIIPEKAVLASNWWRHWPARVALMVCLTLLAFVPVLLSSRQPRDFARYLNEVVAATWNQHRHVDFQTNNLAVVRAWLQAKHVDSSFTVPSALQEASLFGARVLEWNGHKVAFLCYLQGPQHLHFLVGDLPDMADAPLPKTIQMAECHHWATFCWMEGKRSYVLTGIHMKEFLKRFRKDGEWRFKKDETAEAGVEQYVRFWAPASRPNSPSLDWIDPAEALPQQGHHLFRVLGRRLAGVAGAEINRRFSLRGR